MSGHSLSIQEIETLGYYDFMSYLEVPYFHIGGLVSTEKLAELCRVDRDKKVLMVGCGTGFSACYLAKKVGCFVVGVDIAELSIEKARERAKRESLEGKTDFLIGDAYSLPFEAGTFDAVITEFVSQFLDRESAFREFARVLKPGGCMGINEMYREKEIPPEPAEKINHAEGIFGEITGLPFTLPTPEEWERDLEKAGLKEVRVRKYKPGASLEEVKKLVWAMGGTLEFVRYFSSVAVKMIKYMLVSKKIRQRFRKLGEGKKILLRKKPTSRYVGYVLATGTKPGKLPEGKL